MRQRCQRGRETGQNPVFRGKGFKSRYRASPVVSVCREGGGEEYQSRACVLSLCVVEGGLDLVVGLEEDALRARKP